MTRLAACATLLTMTMAIGGCGGDSGDQTGSGAGKTKVDFVLQYLASGPQAGFMYAKKLGYYNDVGLDVSIEEGQGSSITAKLVASGTKTLGFADASSVMATRAAGGKVTIVAPVFQVYDGAIISKTSSGITSPKDLVGKTVGVQAAASTGTLLRAIFEKNGINQSAVEVNNIDPSAFVGALKQGRVDAILGGPAYQGVQLEELGEELNQLLYAHLGVSTIASSIVANDTYLKENPQVVSKFIAASLKGFDAARKDPAAAAEAVKAAFPSSGKLEKLAKQLKTEEQFICAPGAKSLGIAPPEAWTQTFDLLTKYNDLPTSPPVSSYYTDEHVPADAPPC
jgi:NitT/TauT family transport system substrate-binding protein